MIKVAVASGNAGKIKEIMALVSSDLRTACSIQDVLGTFPEVIEDGNTFIENAIKKVADLPTLPNVIYLSDDSGLSVDALDGRPGIYSARYGGGNLTNAEQCDLLLKELGTAQNRNAHYTCAIAIKFPSGQVEVAEGHWHGQIGYVLKGTKGFGYDPIFIPAGLEITAAELDPEEKNKISHRHHALSAAKEMILRFCTESV
ncbi:MAG: RdgB/HAM1 family non-canonical purine NTP pyrophosphatase [Candidatus Margulisbacteria bacterium]|nr:RdgB/HAM1 family non-canonical purine NTP pyrophosphatase [Candidatus Margulisiibacteriota bacterium]